MKSCFAPAGRASADELERTIELVAQSAVITALLRSATAMMGVLNEQRQIVTLNTTYLDTLDIPHADDVLGLRPGEAIGCEHSGDDPGGCGMSPKCRTCGATIAIATSQHTGQAVQRECVFTVRDRKGASRDLCFIVRASPFELEDLPFTVFCMTDVSHQKRHAALERAFLHDISNLVSGLSNASELLLASAACEIEALSVTIREIARRLSREVIVQRLLLSDDPKKYRQDWRDVSISKTIAFLEGLFKTHPAAASRQLFVCTELAVDECHTDPSLLERVLTNMLVNAFEASASKGVVRLDVSSSASEVHFGVWNAECMTSAVAAQVFHRYFSTKKGLGRGNGTYAMRLLGETLLHGKVGFTSSSQAGTTFYLDLPRNGRRSNVQS